MIGFDREKARTVVVEAIETLDPALTVTEKKLRIGGILGALEACVVPAVPAIDRDELAQMVYDYTWVPTRELLGDEPDGRDYAFADLILALVRPAPGVTLTPAEAHLAATSLRSSLNTRTPAPSFRLQLALAEKLEAAS